MAIAQAGPMQIPGVPPLRNALDGEGWELAGVNTQSPLIYLLLFKLRAAAGE
ncbi:MAG TPA: hypothetical protein VFX49_16500 [Chloroflexota bacterium]|nr:hypothetical protein [Chloroflexota bacterium]